jgi:uncharacterized protein (DUF2252 family)
MPAVLPFREMNSSFEAWLRDRCIVIGCEAVEADLKQKHDRMKKNAFVFLRATFFRWARIIESRELCLDLADAPTALSIGDAHIENFGTWRDVEGRLIWGANDFDEAAEIPYPFDLVRLAASARLAPDLFMSGQETCAAILSGYKEEIANPRPTVLDEHHNWLRPLVVCPEEKRAKFWREIDELVSANPPRFVRDALIAALPQGAQIVRFAARAAGGGSLGRPRYVVIANWRGGRVLREAKALVPSAWDWAHGSPNTSPRFAELAAATTRAADPFMAAMDGFIIRRLAPDSRKAELENNPGDQLQDRVLQDTRLKNEALQGKLLKAMGREIGSLHAATANLRAVMDHLNGLKKHDPEWLRAASKKAARAVEEDFKSWASA